MRMNEYKLTGGARIGMVKATYPFATLIVNKNQLELKASILGNFIFQPKDIISIESYTERPIIEKGIKINHRISNYKTKVIFWSMKNPDEIINEIKKTGFLNSINSTYSNDDFQIIKKQRQGSFPIKKPFVIGAFVTWNLLILSDVYTFVKKGIENSPLGNGILSAITLLFGFAILTLFSLSFRKIILKDGKEIDDIKKNLYLIILVSGFMLIIFLLISNIEMNK